MLTADSVSGREAAQTRRSRRSCKNKPGRKYVSALRLLMLFELAADDHDLAFALDDSALVAHGFD